MAIPLNQIQHDFLACVPQAGMCSLRHVSARKELISVRNEQLEKHTIDTDVGLIVTVMAGGGCGYASTARTDREGIRQAIEQAGKWAEISSHKGVFDYQTVVMPQPGENYCGPEGVPGSSLSLKQKIEMLQDESRRMAIDSRIQGRSASLELNSQISSLLYTNGNICQQTRHWVMPQLSALAFAGGETQIRSLGGELAGMKGRQGGLEGLEHLRGRGEGVAEEAMQLLLAPVCPDETVDVLLMPDQMVMQIHESVGHPLELDRILGDERNMAGTSFVTQDMVGSYRYGSELMNISFDPTIKDELASYGWDDDGEPARKELLIENGILKGVLGGAVSRARSGVSTGAACSRAQGWNRPPVDRMANINLEPGAMSLDEMIASVENGVLMKTNRSWSIDDSRNNFQFGCEWGQLIKNGELQGVVKNPGYRGISASFWRNLKAVGNAETREVLGVSFCGKAEPGQVIEVGHASPACLFSDVDVFGGGHA